MSEEPRPDPSNSPPEVWTLPMTDEERAEFDERRAQHRAERENPPAEEDGA